MRAKEIINECMQLAVANYSNVNFDGLKVTVSANMLDTGSIDWDEDGEALITLSTRIQNETSLRDILAHELAHYLMGELHTLVHNKRPHGALWQAYYSELQGLLIWKVYYPEDYA